MTPEHGQQPPAPPPTSTPEPEGLPSIQITDGQLTIPVSDDGADAAYQSALSEPPPASTDEPPYIRRVWLRHFKGFDDCAVDLGMFNVLAGANNSGKSTLLQGIDLIFALLKLHSDGDHLAESGRLLPPGVLPVAAVRDLYYSRIWRRANAYVDATVGAEFADTSSVEFGVRYLFGGANSRVLSSNGMSGVRLRALLSKPAVWVPSAVGIVRDEEYRTPARRISFINTGRHHEVLRNLLRELSSDSARFETLQRILEDRFGAKLGNLEFDEERDQFVSADYLAGPTVNHDLYSAGAGFIQVTQLLAFILSRRTSIVLLDEPDAHLHSSLQKVVIEILDELSREEGFQVVLATHSKEIINFVDPTRLILIESGTTRAAPVSDEVTPMAILKSLGAIDNVDAFALVKNRCCLFVEGLSDSTVLGRFAAILGIRSFTGDNRVVTVPVGGADRFEHVQQLDVFENLLGSSIASLEVRDRDGMSDENRDRTVSSSSRPLHVWELDCIESYLLKSTVIVRVINEISAERGVDLEVTDLEIQELLSEAAHELEEPTEVRLSQRYADDIWRLDKERVDISVAIVAARSVMTELWPDPEKRLRLVSGKRLLGSVRALIQERFKVNFGNERLAEEFAAHEVPTEVSNLLRKVAELAPPPPTDV